MKTQTLGTGWWANPTRRQRSPKTVTSQPKPTMQIKKRLRSENIKSNKAPCISHWISNRDKSPLQSRGLNQ